MRVLLLDLLMFLFPSTCFAYSFPPSSSFTLSYGGLAFCRFIKNLGRFKLSNMETVDFWYLILIDANISDIYTSQNLRERNWINWSSDRRYCIKKVFLKISQNSQDSTCVGASFWIMLGTLFFTEHLPGSASDELTHW